MGLPFFLLEESFWRIRCVFSWTLPWLPFFFLFLTHLLFLISHSLGWVDSAYSHSSHEWPRAITAPWNGVYSQKFWTLNVLRCAQFDCGIFPRQDVRVPVFWISYCAHIVILMQVCLVQKKNATNLSPLSFLSFSIVCDSQRPPIPAKYFKFRLGLTNHHISLRSKRFLLLSEQRKTEGRDFRLWPRKNGLTVRNIGTKSLCSVLFCYYVFAVLFCYYWYWKMKPKPSLLFYSRRLWLTFLILCSETARKRLLRGLPPHAYTGFLVRFRPVFRCRPPCYYHY